MLIFSNWWKPDKTCKKDFCFSKSMDKNLFILSKCQQALPTYFWFLWSQSEQTYQSEPAANPGPSRAGPDSFHFLLDFPANSAA